MSRQPSHAISLVPLAFATALVPLITIHLCYWLSASEQLVPWCLPWFQSCTSISGASRQGIAYFVFKGGMLPACVLMAAFWWACRHWLAGLGRGTSVWWWLGMISVLPLLVYTLALGHMGDTLNLLRRTGVVGFFGLTFLAQVGLGAALYRAGQSLGHCLLGLSSFTLAVGLVSVLISLIWPSVHQRSQDGFEWSLAVLLNLQPLVVAFAWRRQHFAVRFVRG